MPPGDRRHPGARLRELVEAPGPLVSAAIWDCMTARICEQAGMQGLFLSGAALSGARLGLPDFGFLGLGELAEGAARVAASVEVPVLVDADTGFGNLLNAVNTAATLDRAGAAGMMIEDQAFPKRCGHLGGTAVVPVSEQLPKLRAILAERPSPDFLVMARTDAVGVNGVDDAIDRARRYRDAGADITFVEAMRTRGEVERVGREVEGPKAYNIATGGHGPSVPITEIGEMGFDWVIVAGIAMAGVMHGVKSLAEQVMESDDDGPIVATGFSPRALAELFGADSWRDIEDRYAAEGGP